MRVTATTKLKTRERIIEEAARLFKARGFNATSTRDISEAAGVAAGTLFNYFPSKDALALHFVGVAMDKAHTVFIKRRRGDETVEELLFSFIMTQLRQLHPMRKYLGEIIETALGPFHRVSETPDKPRIRDTQLEIVTDLLLESGYSSATSFVTQHLYWTLYLGVLTFWSRDRSPKQQDTLVVLDESIRMFIQSLRDTQ